MNAVTTFGFPEPGNQFVEFGRELVADIEPTRSVSEYDGTEYTTRIRRATHAAGTLAVQQRHTAQADGTVTEHIDLLWSPETVDADSPNMWVIASSQAQGDVECFTRSQHEPACNTEQQAYELLNNIYQA